MNRQKLTTEQLRVKGFEALVAALGPADAVRFLQQYDLGSGDYTRERTRLLGNKTARQIFEALHPE